MIFIGELLKQAERYLAEGVHPRVLCDGFDLAQKESANFLETFKVRCILPPPLPASLPHSRPHQPAFTGGASRRLHKKMGGGGMLRAAQLSERGHYRGSEE